MVSYIFVTALLGNARQPIAIRETTRLRCNAGEFLRSRPVLFTIFSPTCTRAGAILQSKTPDEHRQRQLFPEGKATQHPWLCVRQSENTCGSEARSRSTRPQFNMPAIGSLKFGKQRVYRCSLSLSKRFKKIFSTIILPFSRYQYQINRLASNHPADKLYAISHEGKTNHLRCIHATLRRIGATNPHSASRSSFAIINHSKGCTAAHGPNWASCAASKCS